MVCRVRDGRGRGHARTGVRMLFEPSYAAATVSDPPTAIAAAMELVSHIPMAFAVVYAFNARHFRLGTVGLASLVISLLYHACRSSLMCLDIPVGNWRLQDHTFVLWVLGETGLHLYMGSLTGPGGRGFFTVLGYLTFPLGSIAVNFWPYSLLSGLIMVSFLVVAGAVRLGLLLCDTQKDEVEEQGRTSDHLTLVFLLITLCSAAIGYVLYSFGDDNPAGNSAIDAISHILWHCFSGIALFAASASVSYRTEAALRHRYAHSEEK
jgi:hypothetical protein